MRLWLLNESDSICTMPVKQIRSPACPKHPHSQPQCNHSTAMAYQVLARKYRPQRFSDVIGQDHVTRTLLNALAQNRIAHGYIFSGHRGISKTTIARISRHGARTASSRSPASKERPTPEPCGSVRQLHREDIRRLPLRGQHLRRVALLRRRRDRRRHPPRHR